MTVIHKIEQLIQRDALRPFNFLQIGGFDGVTGDPIFSLVKKYKMPGVIVEPQPGPFEQLTHNYRGVDNVRLFNAAVDWTLGTKKMWHVKPIPGYDWVQQLTSFNKATVLHHAESCPDLPNHLEQIEVHTISLPWILGKAEISRIGLLQIDTEGYDFEIIKMAFSVGQYPKAIHFEHFHLTDDEKRECSSLLNKSGYVSFSGHMDTLSIRIGEES